jgi:2-dehydropantoate 2-reductase
LTSTLAQRTGQSVAGHAAVAIGKTGMKITVLGAGALGGYFGGRLVENGADVTFLVRPARQAQLDAEGLRIVSPLGDSVLKVAARTRETIGADADIVLLTCKAYDLDDAITSILPAIGAQTAILPILNGMAHIDTLTARFGARRVIGGLARIQATLAPDGRITHLNDWNEIVFGELDAPPSPRIRALHALFKQPQVNASMSPNIREELWKKLVHLSTVAAVTTLTRQAIGRVNQTRDGPWLIETTLVAAARIAAAEGYPMSETTMSRTRATFSAPNSAYKASMLRDMERGGATEGEHILGYMRDRAAAHGLDAPIFRIAAAHVQAYERARVTA